MTRLAKEVRREIESSGQALIVSLTPEGLMLREKGRRKSFGPLPYGWLYLQAAKLEADSLRAQRRHRRARAKRGLLV